jgi:peptidoglycan/xylan/chitin deacetylase (PgdA/CDA1 family)
MIRRPKKQQLLRLLPSALVRVRGAATGTARYLTFDDGPHPEYTPALLDLLDTHGVKAGFFLIGREAEKHPHVVERIVAAGHALGNHSYSHPQFAALDIDAQISEINRCDRVLAGFDGLQRHAFRPPRGELSPQLLWRCARRRQNIVYWSRDSLDYQTRRSPAELAEALLADPPAAGEIILMHDDAACSADMLRVLLPRWRTAGFDLRALPMIGCAA